MTEKKNRNSLKPVGSRPGVTYVSCKVHKASVVDFLLFRLILATLNTLTLSLLAPILKPLTTNESTVKESFHSAEEIVHH